MAWESIVCTAVVIVLFGLEHEAQPAADAVEKSTEIHQQKKNKKNRSPGLGVSRSVGFQRAPWRPYFLPRFALINLRPIVVTGRLWSLEHSFFPWENGGDVMAARARPLSAQVPPGGLAG